MPTSSERKAAALPDVPYLPELVEETSALTVFRKYVEPVKVTFRRCAPEIQLEINRAAHKDDEKKRREAGLLYQIKAHPRTKGKYEYCRCLLERYYTQKCPEDMKYEEWQKARLHYKAVIEEITHILRRQNHMEEDKVSLVKGKDNLYFKAYSQKVQEEADALNEQMAMQRITQLASSGTKEDFERCGVYRRLMLKKQREQRHQTTPFAEMQEDPEIRQWLESWELADQWGESKIKLNDRQLYGPCKSGMPTSSGLRGPGKPCREPPKGCTGWRTVKPIMCLLFPPPSLLKRPGRPFWPSTRSPIRSSRNERTFARCIRAILF